MVHLIGKMKSEVKMAVFRTRCFHLFPTKGCADGQRREKSNICDLKARKKDFGGEDETQQEVGGELDMPCGRWMD